jgi:hypothetical protein
MIPCYTCLNSDLLLTLKPPNDCFLITNAKITDWRNQKIHHRNQSSMTIFDSLLRFLSWCTWFTWGMFGWCPHRAASRHTFRTIFLAHILVRVRTCGMLQCDHSSVVHFCATAYQSRASNLSTALLASPLLQCGAVRMPAKHALNPHALEKVKFIFLLLQHVKCIALFKCIGSYVVDDLWSLSRGVIDKSWGPSGVCHPHLIFRIFVMVEWHKTPHVTNQRT